jgi:Mrp family chromosome partitioning ATPase
MTRIYDALQRRSKVGTTAARSVLPRVTTLPREAVLALYNSIESRLPRDAPRILQAMSSTHGEGTSTVARDLVTVAVEDVGKRVLSVTIAPRAISFGAPSEIGLEAVIRGDTPITDIVDRGLGRSLFETTLAVDGANSIHLFDTPAIDAVLRATLTMVDLVIIDAPPVLSDVAGVAFVRHVGGVVLVVEAERTRAPILEKAHRIIDAHGGHIVGVVMNKRRFHIPSALYRRL